MFCSSGAEDQGSGQKGPGLQTPKGSQSQLPNPLCTAVAWERRGMHWRSLCWGHPSQYQSPENSQDTRGNQSEKQGGG